MKAINYILNGFGYTGISDFKRAFCGFFLTIDIDIKLVLVALLGWLRMLMKDYTGFDLPVFTAFVFLIGAEFYTGLRVASKVKGEKFKSRKLGRMILKIGTYLLIISLLHQFSRVIEVPDLMGISLNPFVWLYYTVFIAIVFQLLISWLENLGMLGYKETRTIAGYILRKFNKWFEFDGSKNNPE